MYMENENVASPRAPPPAKKQNKTKIPQQLTRAK